MRLLAGSAKDRSNDELANLVRLDVEAGARPEVPDHAIDMHTARGRERGRDLAHFLTGGASVEPELADRERRWRTELLERLGIEADPE